MDEFELIQKYFVRTNEAADVITGIGDDGAVLRPPPGADLVSVIDTLIEGVHFPLITRDIEAESVGHRAVAVNLSDIAAMGAEPRWMTLALTLQDADEGWLDFFARGLHGIAAQHGVQLVGGDTTKGERVVVTVQVTGLVDPGQAIYRSGAQVGDTVYVSGNIGDAAAGLALLDKPPAEILGPLDYLVERFLSPSPRVALGRSLAGVATAAIDISDGLYTDLVKLLAASRVGAAMDLDKLPISLALKSFCNEEQQMKYALSGGDDYELCFTSSQQLPAEIEGVPVTAIGTVVEGDQLVCRDAHGIVEYDDSGYRHFQ